MTSPAVRPLDLQDLAEFWTALQSTDLLVPLVAAADLSPFRLPLPHRPGWFVLHQHDEGEPCRTGAWPCSYVPTLRTRAVAWLARLRRSQA